MKFPKTIRTYCPYCKKHTEHKVIEVKKRKASSLSRGSKYRARNRGLARGSGGRGRYSKKPLTKWKRVGVKASKHIDIRLQCKECGKQHIMHNTFRVRKLEFA